MVNHENAPAAPVAHWPLEGDCRDHSGGGCHGINHGVDLGTGAFDGRSAFIEAPDHPALRLGDRDFSLAAWVWTPGQPDDIAGTVFEKFDPARRRGVTLAIGSSSGGYQGPGDDRQVHFGIDDASLGEWRDCGRPNASSNYVSNSLTVFDGDLYAATIGGDPADRGRVSRYLGDDRWADCGRPGDGGAEGVMPLLVHGGSLHAVTTTYDWTRVLDGGRSPGRVYRYLGGRDWEDCGEPGAQLTLNGAVSYRGRIYVGGGPVDPGVFVREDDGTWRRISAFEATGPRRCFPHAMTRFHGELVTGFPGIHGYDGERWRFLGLPAGGPHEQLQTHALHVHRGRLVAGTWPDGVVAVHEGGEVWRAIGRVGEDGTEVCGLVVYNGKLYGGSIPRAEVCRYDGETAWTSLVRFYSPPGWTPEPPQHSLDDPPPSREGLNAWSRVTSLTVHEGKLFASTGSCTSSPDDAPCDARGKVFCVEAGRVASCGRDIGAGWRHLAAIRRGDRLEVHVDGRRAATSSPFDPGTFDLDNDRPLLIGFGQTDYFRGRMRDVRLYDEALTPAAVEALAARRPR